MNIESHPLDLPIYVGWYKTNFHETINGRTVVRIIAHAGLEGSGDICFHAAFKECLSAVYRYASEIEPFATVTNFELRVLWLEGKELEVYRTDGQSCLKFSEMDSLDFN